MSRFLQLSRSPQAPPMSAGGCRDLARRLWQGHAAAPAPLLQRAAQLADATPNVPGRVVELGRFEDPSGRQALLASLPAPAGAALRRSFEWYGCRGAGFHTDAHYPEVLFGVWCLAGPPRDLVFGDCGLRIPCSPGDLVVFDPFQPHAVLDPGQPGYERDRYEGAPASLFLGFEVELTDAVRERFDVGPARAGALAISSATAVNAETGQMAR